MFLVGDIGGTKTRLALYVDKAKKLAEKEFVSKDFSSLLPMIEQFLQTYSEGEVKSLCLGIAGPVHLGVCRATNLPWQVDIHELGKALGIKKATLINDLEANAWGIGMLKPEEFFVLNDVKPQEGNAALIAAGTGLGEAGLFWRENAYIPFATEGGHSDFAPREDREIRLLKFLQGLFDHVSYERILSGKGIYFLYRFLVDIEKVSPSQAVEKHLKNEDPAVIITKEALEKGCPTCSLTLSWFTSLYGAEAGNLALKMLAYGGVYIGGGIAPKILPFFKKDDFMQAFLSKGRFRGLLSSIPVKVILNDKAALLGALNYAEKNHKL